MINKHFATWTRRTAFALTLSEPAISNLLGMLDWEDKVKDPNETLNGLLPATVGDPHRYGFRLYTPTQASYLERRGLIIHAAHVNDPTNYCLTEAGTHVARLLRCAGFKNHYYSEYHNEDSQIKTMEVPVGGPS